MRKSKFISFGLAALLMTNLTAPVGCTSVQASTLQEKKQYIVTTKDGMQNGIRAHYSSYLVTDDLPGNEAEDTSIFVKMSLTDSEAAALKNDKMIVGIEADKRVAALSTDITETTSESNWNKEIINAENVAAESDNSRKVKIALIDSGVDYTNDLPVVERMNFIPGEENVSPVYDDPTGHGTSVAGVIASNGEDSGIKGINPNVELYSAKILGFSMQAPVSRVIDAIEWAIAKDVDIINLSLGTDTNSPALHAAIQKAYDNNILIVAAAGNDADVEYPAAYDEVMAVGSVDSNGQVCEDSAEGEELEIVAPGEKVVSTSHFGGVASASGTSLAAPHVVGVASLLLEKDFSVSNDFIRTVLDASANKVDDENICGNGLVDYEYANEIYNTVKDTYTEEKDTESYSIEENTSTVDTCDTSDIVEGSWSKADHVSVTNTAANNQDIGSVSSALLTSIKAGARANDDYVGGEGALTYAPQFHGWVYYGDKTSTVIDYVSCYIYMIDIAKYYYKNDKFPTASTTKYTDITDPQVTKMLSYLNNSKGNVTNPTDNSTATWSAIFKNYSMGSITKARMCAFLYGMACHIATDTFAHSAYYYDSATQKYLHIKHKPKTVPTDKKELEKYNSTPYADNRDTKDYPERYECAKEIAQNVVYRYYNGVSNKQPGYAEDFIVPTYENMISNGGTLSFKLRKMLTFAEENGIESGDPDYAYFKALSY